MRFTRVYLLSAAASVLLGALAHADEHVQFAQGGDANRAELQDPQPPELIGHYIYPQTDWTSSIGTGTAATLEERRAPARQVQNDTQSPARTVRYPQAIWSSRIGTGTAAMFETERP